MPQQHDLEVSHSGARRIVADAYLKILFLFPPQRGIDARPPHTHPGSHPKLAPVARGWGEGHWSISWSWCGGEGHRVGAHRATCVRRFYRPLSVVVRGGVRRGGSRFVRLERQREESRRGRTEDCTRGRLIMTDHCVLHRERRECQCHRCPMLSFKQQPRPSSTFPTCVTRNPMEHASQAARGVCVYVGAGRSAIAPANVLRHWGNWTKGPISRLSLWEGEGWEAGGGSSRG